jgi:5-methylcytosine-specific restriction endonuclease McrA
MGKPKNGRSIGNYRYALKQAIAKRDGMYCNICRRVILYIDDDVTIDHIAPLSAGGKTEFDNLAIAHDACNRKKGNYVGTPKD